MQIFNNSHETSKMIPDFTSKKLKVKKCIFDFYLNFFPQKYSYVTFAGRTDGIGAQMHAAISVLLFAYKMGLKYAHTPLSNIEHGLSNDLKWDFFLV